MSSSKYTHCLLVGICISLCVILGRQQLISVINIGSTHTEDLNRIASDTNDNIIEEDTHKFTNGRSKYIVWLNM